MRAADPVALRRRLDEVSAALAFEVVVRPMMGGFIGYADGRPFVSLSQGGFGIKLLPPDQDRLLERVGSRRQRHGDDQPESRTYIAMGEHDLADDDVLVEWLRLAAATAPAPRPRRQGVRATTKRLAKDSGVP